MLLTLFDPGITSAAAYILVHPPQYAPHHTTQSILTRDETCMQQWLTMFKIESTAMQERCLVAPSPILTLDETCKQCLTVLRVESDAGEMSCSAFCLSRISRTQDTRCHHLKLWYSSTTCFNISTTIWIIHSWSVKVLGASTSSIMLSIILNIWHCQTCLHVWPILTPASRIWESKWMQNFYRILHLSAGTGTNLDVSK